MNDDLNASELLEVRHAELHSGTIVPSISACPEHTVANGRIVRSPSGWIVWAYDHGSLRLEHRCGYLVAYDAAVEVSAIRAAMNDHRDCLDGGGR